MQDTTTELLHPHAEAVLRLPPYCKVCHVPFEGIRSVFPRLRGIVPDTQHPGFCNKCADVDFPPHDQIVSVLFCDIRNFTTLTEQNSPSAMAGMLRRYFTVVSRIIIANEGFVEKFVGDAVMSFFNAPMPLERHEAAAVLTAMQIRRAIHEMNLPGLEVGIGVNSGNARVGKLGPEPGMEFGIVGDCVNVAARLQSQAIAGEIVLSHDVFEKSRDVIPTIIPWRECSLELKGKARPYRCVVVGT
ncbi:MAG: adenylate/guanylate cyclase domain-containing protein [Bacteroidota bacterium]